MEFIVIIEKIILETMLRIVTIRTIIISYALLE